MIEKILINNEGERFYRFANADGKMWVMPARHLRTAMELYQPSGRNGRMLKRWLPLLHRIAVARRAIHIETMRCRLNDALRQVLESIFDTNDLEFAIFGGTPCVHQKITMQLSKGSRILGYCKITDNQEVACLFDREAQLLKELRASGTKCIPECLYHGSLGKNIRLFVQSTAKTLGSKVVHEWREMHDNFLLTLNDTTKRSLRFESSDYFHTIKALAEHYDWLPDTIEIPLVERSIRRIYDRWYGSVVSFSAYHADFTPWNMYVEKGRLYVFDWEYAQMTYPPMLDRYHFFTQTAIFERHWNAEGILQYMKSDAGRWMYANDYMAYLIDMIARFTVRERGKVEGDMASSMKLWGDLLALLHKNTL